MQELFTALTRAIEASPGIALSAAFAWGILSIVWTRLMRMTKNTMMRTTPVVMLVVANVL